MHRINHEDDLSVTNNRINDNFEELVRKLSIIDSNMKKLLAKSQITKDDIKNLIIEYIEGNSEVVVPVTENWIIERGLIDGATDDDIIENFSNTDDIIES